MKQAPSMPDAAQQTWRLLQHMLLALAAARQAHQQMHDSPATPNPPRCIEPPPLKNKQRLAATNVELDHMPANRNRVKGEQNPKLNPKP